MADRDYLPSNRYPRISRTVKIVLETMKYKAVIFDMGGVVSKTSLGYFEKTRFPTWEPKCMTPCYYHPDFAQTARAFETGVMSAEEMEPIFTEHCKKYFSKPDLPFMDLITCTRDFVGNNTLRDESMHAAILKIRENGLKTAVLTNNCWFDKEKTISQLYFDTQFFDVVIESCRLGIMKPDREIYELALEKVGCKAEETVFLDDYAPNTDAAAKLGITTIFVDDQEKAARELIDLLEIK